MLFFKGQISLGMASGGGNAGGFGWLGCTHGGGRSQWYHRGTWSTWSTRSTRSTWREGAAATGGREGAAATGGGIWDLGKLAWKMVGDEMRIIQLRCKYICLKFGEGQDPEPMCLWRRCRSFHVESGVVDPSGLMRNTRQRSPSKGSGKREIS